MKILYFISLFFILFLIHSCSKDDDSIVNIPPCPPLEIVPIPPYNSPVWHPNGNLIGFNYTPLKEIQYPYGDHCRGRQIWNSDSTGFWLINSDGKNMHRVLPFQLQTPCWSPDGQWIAFVSSDQIYKMRFDGVNFDTTSIIQLTFQGNNYFPAWSPDGNWIAYDSNHESPNGMHFIWKMNSDGTKKSRISYSPEEGEIRMPHWSQNNVELLHIRFSKEFRSSEVFVMDTSGNTLSRITLNSHSDTYPRYVHNSSNILFLSQPAGNLPNIYSIDSSGFNLNELTEDGVEGDSGTPFSISPDGRYVVYTKYDWTDWSYANGTLWILDITYGNKFQLTFNEPPNE